MRSQYWFHPRRDVSSDKSWDTKDEISSSDLAGGKKQNHNHNRMDDKNTNAAQGRSTDFKRHCWVFYRWSSKYSSESPQKMFLIWVLPSQCLQNNSVLCYLKDQGITKIMFRLHPGHEGSFCFVHGPISKSQYNAGVQCGLVQCMLVSFLSWRKLVQEISRNSSSGWVT